MNHPVHSPVLFSIEDFRRMVASGVFDEKTGKIELIEGELTMMSPASYDHDYLIQYLNEWSIESTRGKYRVGVQMGLELFASQSVPEPDLYWVSSENRRGNRPTPVEVPLVIEVSLSSLNFDTTKKQQLYAMDQFAEYWVVDAESESVIVHRQPLNDRYANVTTHSVGESISPQCVPDAKLDLEWLFHG